MKHLLVCSLLVIGCTARPPENGAPAKPGFQPLEDLVAAKQRAAQQNKALVVFSVLGDYKKHC